MTLLNYLNGIICSGSTRRRTGSNLTRKIAVNVYMTLDGHGELPKYPGSDVRSKEPSEGFIDMWIKRYDWVDTILYGRRSYEGHVDVHSESARKASDPEYLFEFSRFLRRCQKIVLFRSLKKTDWQNSRIRKERRPQTNRRPPETGIWKGHHRRRGPLARPRVHPEESCG